MNLFIRQKDIEKQTKYKQVSKINVQLPKGKHGNKDISGACDKHIHNTIYKIHNQQGLSAYCALFMEM